MPNTDNVIRITLYEDLGSDFLNNLRCRMQMAEWRGKWLKAQSEQDFDAMDQLDKQYEMVGLP